MATARPGVAYTIQDTIYIMRKKNYVLATAVLALAATAATAQGQNAVRRLTMKQCMDMALTANYGVKMADKSVERARAMQGTAWDIDKTDVTLGQDPTAGGSPDNALTFSQSIDFPTVYVARRRQLKAETQAERSRADVVRAQLRADVAAAYYQLAYQAECVRLLQRQDSLLDQCHRHTTKLHEAGATHRMEQLLAEKAYRENQLELQSARGELSTLQLQLSTLLNTTATVMPAETGLQVLSAPYAAYGFAQTAAGRYAQDKLTAADRAVAVAKNEYAPTLSLALRQQLVIGSWNPYNADRSRFAAGNFMGFEVGVGVPLFYGATKARVKAAKKDREIAELEMSQSRQQGQQEYAACQNRLRIAAERMRFYEDDAMKRVAEMGTLSKAEYDNGEMTYTEYVNVLQENVNTCLKRAAAINDYNQAVIALERILGKVGE